MDQATTIYILPVGGGRYQTTSHGFARTAPYNLPCSGTCFSFEIASPHFGNHAPILFDAVDPFCGAWVTRPNLFESVFSSELSLAGETEKTTREEAGNTQKSKSRLRHGSFLLWSPFLTYRPQLVREIIKTTSKRASSSALQGRRQHRRIGKT